MKDTTERFVCSHCGHHFEAPREEGLVCPNCFWSTSVKKEETAPSPGPAPAKQGPPKRAPLHFESSKIWFTVGAVFFVLLLGGIFFFAARHLKKQDEIIHSIEKQNAKVLAEEQKILEQPLSQGALPPLTESEKSVQAQKNPLRTRTFQGVATPPWDEKQFEVFLKSEEARYKIPFERSYRRKLTNLFKTHYLPAAAAFEAKNYAKARDEWIRSLTFPVYHNDPPKHRGVVLTMLRPFVNDTLSKVGAMNAMLTEKDLYRTEDKIRADYEALHELLGKESWEEANAKFLELEKELAAQKSRANARPPALPKEIAAVDADIREVLLQQVAPRELGERDWEALRGDLKAKETILQSRLPPAKEADS